MTPPAPDDLGPIVSSGHLASGALPALSEFEFAMNMTVHAFQRWMIRCMAAAGIADLSPLDVLVLHNVNHRGKPKRLADVCLVLNIEDTHLVNYSMKKLERLKLLKGGRKGKEKTVEVTPAGEEACRRYAQIREQLLVRSVRATGIDPVQLSEIAAAMPALLPVQCQWPKSGFCAAGTKGALARASMKSWLAIPAAVAEPEPGCPTAPAEPVVPP